MNIYRLKISGVPFNDNTGYTDSQLNWRMPYIAADSNPDSANYDLITPQSTTQEIEDSIAIWEKYYHRCGKDYMFMTKQLRALRDVPTVGGFANFNDDTKKILLKHFSGGPGQDYINALYTEEEHDKNYSMFQKNLNKSFISRDDGVFHKVRKKVYKGQMPLDDASQMAIGIKDIRDEYLRDYIMGVSHGDTVDGVLNWIENSSSFQFENVSAVDQGDKKFTVSNFNIIKIKRYIGAYIKVIGSTGNDGYYKIADFGKSGSSSWIEVEEAIPSAVADGQMAVAGLKAMKSGDDALKNETLDIYQNGK